MSFASALANSAYQLSLGREAVERRVRFLERAPKKGEVRLQLLRCECGLGHATLPGRGDNAHGQDLDAPWHGRRLEREPQSSPWAGLMAAPIEMETVGMNEAVAHQRRDGAGSEAAASRAEEDGLIRCGEQTERRTLIGAWRNDALRIVETDTHGGHAACRADAHNHITPLFAVPIGHIDIDASEKDPVSDA